MHVENTITIERPIDEVFEYVSTPENDPTWVSVSIRNQRTSPGPIREGMTIEEDIKIFGRTASYTWEVTQYEPPTAIAYRATSGSPGGSKIWSTPFTTRGMCRTIALPFPTGLPNILVDVW